MNFLRTLFTALACLTLGPIASSAAPEKSVTVIEIRSTINPATADYLKTAIVHAEKVGARALVIELDTPGGLISSVREMAQAIDDSKVPVILFVTPAGAAATSAGALLMLASHFALMTPGSTVGAAHPVQGDGTDIKGAMGEKVLNDTVSFAKGLAQVRGRDPELASAIVEKSKSMTAQEALEAKLIDGLASDLTAVFAAVSSKKIKLKSGEVVLDLNGAAIERFDMSLGQKVLNLLAHPNVAATLMSLGMLCIYLELSTPGIGFGGVFGAIFLLLAFMSFQVLPVRMGGMLLAILGVALWAVEVFVPSGALAIGGTLAFVLGMLWLIDPAQLSMGVSLSLILPFAIGLGGLGVLVGYVIKKSRGKPVSSHFGLEGFEGEIVEVRGERAKAHFRGETWDCVRQGGGVFKKGDRVVAVDHQGLTVIAAIKE